MVWSEHWRGLTRSTEQSASTPAVPLRFGKNVQRGSVYRRSCGSGHLRGSVGATAWVRLALPNPPETGPSDDAVLRSPFPAAPAARDS
jgi:hypothetical protein